jgi:prephenate dehydrogenase
VGVAAWAKEILPEGRYFVTMSPTINPAYLNELSVGSEAAHADLFKNSLMVITSLPGTDADALKLVSDLSALLGATPFFADAYEADGLVAAVQQLPFFLATALVDATVNQPGWNEARKLAGKAYARVSLPLLEPIESKFHGQSALINKDNSLRVIDNAIASLRQLRQAIADDDEQTLAERIGAAVDARALWQAQREKSDWDIAPAQPMPTSGEIIGRLFGLGGRKKDKDKGKDGFASKMR